MFKTDRTDMPRGKSPNFAINFMHKLNFAKPKETCLKAQCYMYCVTSNAILILVRVDRANLKATALVISILFFEEDALLANLTFYKRKCY